MATATDKLTVLLADLMSVMETQHVEFKRVMDAHQETLDSFYGSPLDTSWSGSRIASPRRSEHQAAAAAPLELEVSVKLHSKPSEDPSTGPAMETITTEMTEGGNRRGSVREPVNFRTSHSMKEGKPKQEDLQRLDIAMGALVIANTFVMALELECYGHVVGTHVGIPDGMQCDDVQPLFVILEHCFTLTFILEVLYRFWYLRWVYLSYGMNIFDIFLVILASVDLYILAPLAINSSDLHLSRLLRTLKVVRIARLGRTFRLFPGLRLLVHACTSFLPALGWSMILLGLCITSGGILMGTLLQDFVLDESKPLADRLWIWLHYGTAYRAMYTLYEITFAGNWPTYARPVLETVDHAYVFFYLTYITLIVFAVIRVISAVFLSQTLEAASNDAEMMIQERLRKKAAFVQKLEGVFEAMDESGDGLLSECEMTDLLEDKMVQAYLESLEVALPETKALFRLLQNGDGEVTYENFIEGILRCKGPARAMDQIVIQSELRCLGQSVTQLLKSLEEARVIERPRRRHGRSPRPRSRKPTQTRVEADLTLMQGIPGMSRSPWG